MLPVSEHRNVDEATETSEVTDFVRRYYAALERGEPLAGFYISDQEAGPLGPVVKIGSGQGEEFTGYAAVARAVNEVSAGFRGNQLDRSMPARIKWLEVPPGARFGRDLRLRSWRSRELRPLEVEDPKTLRHF